MSTMTKETTINSDHKCTKKENKNRQFVRALYAYTPSNEDELELKINDIIEVIEEIEEGWYKGILKGNIGLFPSNFVTEFSEDSSNIIARKQETSSKSTEKKDTSISANKVVLSATVQLKGKARVSHENVIQDENVKTAALINCDKKMNTAKKSHSGTSPDRSAPELPPKPVREQVKVLYPYQAQNEDELTIKEGDVITIISKEIEDKGWWKGELNNQIGVFPDNFVELIKLEDSIQKRPDRPEKPPLPASPKLNTKSTPETNVADVAHLSEKKVTKTPPAKPPPPEVHRKEKPERPAPPYPSKKPQLPPPVKKPLRASVGPKPTPVSPSAQSFESSCSSVDSAGTNKEELTNPVDEHFVDISSEKPTCDAPDTCDEKNLFDDVKLSSDKLVHLTASRAKVPNRRPPSHVFLKENVDSLILPKGEKPAVPPSRPSPPKIINNVSLLTKQEHSSFIASHVTTQTVTIIPPDVNLFEEIKSELQATSENESLWQKEISDIRKELKLIKESVVSRNEYEELCNQMNNCKKMVHTLKAELDEERKLRIATQLELEKIRKHVLS